MAIQSEWAARWLKLDPLSQPLTPLGKDPNKKRTAYPPRERGEEARVYHLRMMDWEEEQGIPHKDRVY